MGAVARRPGPSFRALLFGRHLVPEPSGAPPLHRLLSRWRIAPRTLIHLPSTAPAGSCDPGSHISEHQHAALVFPLPPTPILIAERNSLAAFLSLFHISALFPTLPCPLQVCCQASLVHSSTYRHWWGLFLSLAPPSRGLQLKGSFGAPRSSPPGKSVPWPLSCVQTSSNSSSSWRKPAKHFLLFRPFSAIPCCSITGHTLPNPCTSLPRAMKFSSGFNTLYDPPAFGIAILHHCRRQVAKQHSAFSLPRAASPAASRCLRNADAWAIFARVLELIQPQQMLLSRSDYYREHLSLLQLHSCLGSPLPPPLLNFMLPTLLL